uniref:XPRLamide neuropeptide n=1 Tax=Eisenia andrei TaxID=168636 RepID=A0A1U9X1S2_9ANNE|nr:XPRLamide neuropeptide precursor [Eisenia andrei]
MKLTTTFFIGIVSYLTLCHESSDGASHLASAQLDDEQDVNRLLSVTAELARMRSRRSTHELEEDKRSPLPRLGKRSDEDLDFEETLRDKRLPRFGREEEMEEKEKRLPRLGVRSPLPRLGRSPLPRLGEERDKRLPRLGVRSPLPRLGLRQSGEDEEEEQLGDDFDGDESIYEEETRGNRLPMFGLHRRASPFPRLGRAAPFPRLGRSEDGKRAAPFPRLGRAPSYPNGYIDYTEVETRAAPFLRLGRASPFPRLG